MLRILIIDDDEFILKGMQAGLTRLGYSVLTDQDPYAGEAAMRSQSWDVVVLDLSMPRRDGLAILTSLTPQQRRRVVVISAETDASILAQVRMLDVAEMLRKPITLSTLCATIEQVTQL
ncbi:MAG: response regulator [Chloroflexi bacterium]|nr:response regulator [Chloroflexota bacterium]